MSSSIFVAGNNRSGTKWISNILLNHKNIAGIQSDYHRGILETNLFNNFPAHFGDLKVNDNFIGFVECFASTDFFKMTGLGKIFLYKINSRNYYDVFSKTMDEYARKEESELWLQKIHLFNYKKVKECFPMAKFIFIKRDIFGNIMSAYILQKKLKGKKSLIKHIIIYTFSEKIFKKYKNDNNVISIIYNDLINNKPETVRKICDFLNLRYSDDLLNVKYRKNTSFGNMEGEPDIFPLRQKIVIKFLHFLFKLFPGKFFEILFKINYKWSGSNFITGTFSELSEGSGLEKVDY